MYVDEQTYLTHYGVKGMKWGVRKDRRSVGSRVAKSMHNRSRSAASGKHASTIKKAGNAINDANQRRSKGVQNIKDVGASIKDVKSTLKSRKAEKQKAKENEKAMRKEVADRVNKYARDVIEPTLMKKFGGRSFNQLSDREQIRYDEIWMNMEAEIYDKASKELAKKYNIQKKR